MFHISVSPFLVKADMECYNKKQVLWHFYTIKCFLRIERGNGLTSVNMTEIVIVNSIGICLMVVLLLIRIENKEIRLISDKLFDIMIWVAMIGCLIEILTFVVDGRDFTGGRALSYILNCLCFIGTCTVGFLWCIFVDYRIHNSLRRIKKKIKVLAIPLAVDVFLNLINLTGCGVMFSISDDNVYSRGSMVWMAYIILFIYYIYSIYIVVSSKKSGLHVKFMSIYYFVIPCMIGTIVQGAVYGITLGWTCVTIAFTFVYIETQSQNIFVDSLSGLYNRKYMNYILDKFKNNDKTTIFGIMLDVNNFKGINDLYGHIKGDAAIRTIGILISDAVPHNGIAVRYAGDEFIIILNTEDEQQVFQVMDDIKQKAEYFSNFGREPYKLSFSMGYSRLDVENGGVEAFLSGMDREMYKSKREYYRTVGNDRRKSRK